MTHRDKLISLIMGANIGTMSLANAERLADHLIANNVIVLPCAIGSTVWIVSKACVEALGKQIPKKPLYIDGDCDLPLCPHCRMAIDETEDTTVCKLCKQSLDWSDT